MDYRIRKYYFLGLYPFHCIEQNNHGHWIVILKLTNENLKLAQSIKKHLIGNQDLIK